MDTIPELHLLISQRKINKAVKKIAGEIRADYADKYPLLIGSLKGSFMFLADLVRHMDFPLELDFIRLASYGDRTESAGQITLVEDLRSEMMDRDVLIIEDIVDTGLTTAFLLDYLRRKSPASVKLCTLLDKPYRRKVHITIDYLGFTVPNEFVVGYGMDWNEKYRNLSAIYAVG